MPPKTDIRIEPRLVEDLLPFSRNARSHSDKQIAQIAASIAEFGWTNPVLIGADNVLIAGHARIAAARNLNIREVPVIVLDHLVDATAGVGDRGPIAWRRMPDGMRTFCGWNWRR